MSEDYQSHKHLFALDESHTAQITWLISERINRISCNFNE